MTFARFAVKLASDWSTMIALESIPVSSAPLEETKEWAIERSIISAREGSTSALGQLLDHYREYLLRVASEEISTDLAVKVAPSDLVQDTCLQAGRDFLNFQGRSEPEIRLWLRQILIHNLRDLQKRFRGTAKRALGCETELDRIGAGLVDSGATPSGIVVANEQIDALERAIERLPEDYRKVVQLRHFDGRTLEEIAEAFGRSGESVRKLWVRAIERLTDELNGNDSG